MGTTPTLQSIRGLCYPDTAGGRCQSASPLSPHGRKLPAEYLPTLLPHTPLWEGHLQSRDAFHSISSASSWNSTYRNHYYCFDPQSNNLIHCWQNVTWKMQREDWPDVFEGLIFKSNWASATTGFKSAVSHESCLQTSPLHNRTVPEKASGRLWESRDTDLSALNTINVAETLISVLQQIHSS